MVMMMVVVMIMMIEMTAEDGAHFFFSQDEFQLRLWQVDVHVHFNQPNHVLMKLYLAQLQ